MIEDPVKDVDSHIKVLSLASISFFMTFSFEIFGPLNQLQLWRVFPTKKSVKDWFWREKLRPKIMTSAPKIKAMTANISPIRPLNPNEPANKAKANAIQCGSIWKIWIFFFSSHIFDVLKEEFKLTIWHKFLCFVCPWHSPNMIEKNSIQSILDDFSWLISMLKTHCDFCKNFLVLLSSFKDFFWVLKSFYRKNCASLNCF